MVNFRGVIVKRKVSKRMAINYRVAKIVLKFILILQNILFLVSGVVTVNNGSLLSCSHGNPHSRTFMHPERTTVRFSHSGGSYTTFALS